MGYTLDFSASHFDLGKLEPSQYVRFETRSHGTVIMVALKQELPKRSEHEAMYYFLITSPVIGLIDGVPAEISIGQKFTLNDGHLTIEITDYIHVDS